jgi:EAL domain-containing protein (putative c-di-GMP-specific phosphodiesterase class I)
MYKAKSGGKAQHHVFDLSLDDKARERLRLETDLRLALDRNELRVYYQPVVSVADGGIRGVEALVRWKHAQRGMVPPSEFIPLAEETGQIVPIGEWVLVQACQQVCKWNRDRPTSPLTVSVNISARQFEDPNLVENIRAVLARSCLDPAHLVLEITETAVMRNPEDAVRKAESLRRVGVRLAIDDFGTGYSSLAYLKQFPVDVLKIDRAFVAGIGLDACDTAIVRSVTGLAQGLGLTVTAEGVETVEQLAFLRTIGCATAQGHLFARPAPSATIAQLLRPEAMYGRAA